MTIAQLLIFFSFLNGAGSSLAVVDLSSEGEVADAQLGTIEDARLGECPDAFLAGDIG